MRRWAWITVLLYAAILAAAALPLVMTVAKPPEDAFLIYSHAGFWIPLGIFTLSQALLLVVPVRAAGGRPISRRTLLIPLIVSGFLAALLLGGLLLSLALAIFGEGDQVTPYLIVSLVWTFLGWLIWAVVFYRYASSDSPESLTARLVRALLRGSILELLVAVPSHVIVRNRNDCCAPLVTMCGIAAGLAVMLASFGPGVFFLFVRRMRRLRREIGPEPPG